ASWCRTGQKHGRNALAGYLNRYRRGRYLSFLAVHEAVLKVCPFPEEHPERSQSDSTQPVRSDRCEFRLGVRTASSSRDEFALTQWYAGVYATQLRQDLRDQWASWKL